jgi:hypothetical protein
MSLLIEKLHQFDQAFRPVAYLQFFFAAHFCICEVIIVPFRVFQRLKDRVPASFVAEVSSSACRNDLPLCLPNERFRTGNVELGAGAWGKIIIILYSVNRWNTLKLLETVAVLL